jgi:hypothetical protein
MSWYRAITLMRLEAAYGCFCNPLAMFPSPLPGFPCLSSWPNPLARPTKKIGGGELYRSRASETEVTAGFRFHEEHTFCFWESKTPRILVRDLLWDTQTYRENISWETNISHKLDIVKHVVGLAGSMFHFWCPVPCRPDLIRHVVLIFFRFFL